LVVCFLFFKEDEIRIRVVANSDCNEDVAKKEEIVNFLVYNILKGKNIDDEFLAKNCLWIDQELKKEFKDVEVRYEKHTFYNKTYNGSVLANGTYKTLLVLVGNAEGSNWWSSIFNGKIHPGSEEIEYKWFIDRKGE
jgi:hypothetical protein